jgi:predicted metal-dependent enzyme (double-stranded beta helix superfamily)
MFDTESFVAQCVEAIGEPEPRTAIKDVLERAMAEPAAVARALPPTRAGISRLHCSPELTILNVIWAPHMSFGPHDHRMWAAIGIYSGGEDNTFFRRSNETIAESGGKSLRPRDVALLGDNTIHAVTNPTDEFTGSIHIYGGDFFATARSEWRGDPLQERPYDADYVVRYFEEANGRRRCASSTRARSCGPRDALAGP